MNDHIWEIGVPDGSPVCRFAAEEFARLIGCMDPCAAARISDRPYAPDPRVLWIGRDAALPQPPPVDDPGEDDAIRIGIRDGAGFITGSNDRSVLIGVYRFFREAGCAFVRPGREGESVPRRDSLALAVSLCDKAACRHRGICLEGANSFENVCEMIDLAPKLGFNAYFTQLFRPAFTFRRWYDHASNPALLPTPVSNDAIDAFMRDYGAEIEKRGLDHHRIGHGWASKILGITSGAWHEKNGEDEVLPERKKLIALIGGERKLFAGSGIDTNLCYSDPQVQALLADAVTDYARAHPEIRHLHFWLADQANNQCECARCRGLRPSDQYVEILNRIDARLRAEGLTTKIVFLIYLDLLWAPLTARFEHPDRFVLMFAPIRRSYSVPMAEDRGRRAAPFARNGFVLPPEAGGSLPYLAAWQEVFQGDSFIFDYHYMWDYLNDPGGWQSVRIMAEDMKNLRGLGLNGMMSCQNQRVFMPSGLGMNLMGEALWAGSAPFEERAGAFFAAAFGPDGGACLEYLRDLSEALDPVILRGEKPVRGAAQAAQFARVPGRIDAFLPVIARNLGAGSQLRQRSWACLAFHAELCRRISRVLLAAAEGKPDDMEARWKEAGDWARENELRVQKEFDVFEFFNVWENKILFRLRNQAEASIE